MTIGAIFRVYPSFKDSGESLWCLKYKKEVTVYSGASVLQHGDPECTTGEDALAGGQGKGCEPW